MYSLQELYKIGNGPSSSHTMGPKKAALIFKDKYSNANRFIVHLYGSLALTGKGHLTDYIIKETLDNCLVLFDYKTETKHPNTLMIEGYLNDKFLGKMTFYSIGGGNILAEGEKEIKVKEVYKENSFLAIKEYLKENNLDLVSYVDSYESIDNYLKEVIGIMYSNIKNGLNKSGVLPGKLKVKRKARDIYFSKSESLLGDDFDKRKLMAYAYAVSEENASGGLVVTAPTCGACGVLPAIMFYLKEKYKTTLKEEINGLKVAGIIGNIVSYNASISGAYAGCQAEVGTATSMAAAYAAYILKGELLNIERAAEIALEHNLGLTCDPVEGYVQIPCIERNALGALRALDSAILALYIDAKEAKISFDTVVMTMLETGLSLPRSLKETSEGGLAKNYKGVKDESK